MGDGGDGERDDRASRGDSGAHWVDVVGDRLASIHHLGPLGEDRWGADIAGAVEGPDHLDDVAVGAVVAHGGDNIGAVAR